MASAANTSPRRKVSKKAATRRKGRTKRRSLSGSPRAIASQTRRNGIAKRRGGRNSPTNGRRALKYSKLALVLPPNPDPLEENVIDRVPVPEGYVFVPKGDVYITRNCRTKTKESEQTVYVVYSNGGKWPVGIRVPSDIHAAVLESAAATASSRASAVKHRDERDLAHSREILQAQFPLMPAESLETVLDHAFLKGSGRVGRTGMKTDERKAILAVEAHIRHTQTPYEALLDGGMDRDDAREAVWDSVKAIKAAWEGGGSEPGGLLALRSRVAA